MLQPGLKIVLRLTVVLLSLNACTRSAPVTPFPPSAALPLVQPGSRAPGPAYPTLATRLQARQAQAETLMRQGDLAAALMQWEILLALDPGNGTFQHRIDTTRALIQEQVATYIHQGEQALRRDDERQAQQAFLAALALDPHHAYPQEALRKIAQRQVKARQRANLAGLARTHAQQRKARAQAMHHHQDTPAAPQF